MWGRASELVVYMNAAPGGRFANLVITQILRTQFSQLPQGNGCICQSPQVFCELSWHDQSLRPRPTRGAGTSPIRYVGGLSMPVATGCCCRGARAPCHSPNLRAYFGRFLQ